MARRKKSKKVEEPVVEEAPVVESAPEPVEEPVIEQAPDPFSFEELPTSIDMAEEEVVSEEKVAEEPVVEEPVVVVEKPRGIGALPGHTHDDIEADVLAAEEEAAKARAEERAKSLKQ